jgi:hypothetical protein
MKNVSTERLTEIVDEVMHLMDAPDIFGFLDGTGNSWAVEKRLQEVMQTRQQFETIELAMYLRTCNMRRSDIPTWQLLLNAAVEMGKMRGDPVDDIFYGLIERRSDPQRNTGYPT